ncbi:histidine kinase dimerization/phosphoacceptor domain -containing protein [Maridesulfovibrio zosterae]|uniref:histidine kinase dimerization/phosphoacceptor domain -containing protein n=1 Tax=Maridesulfovibrio zosterae TaxID=82171 RepID=UPI00040AD891|nr:histidine kinase dimerization/phosphoacceptor domain -containing protein [Maridesulfovibrio zosterae]
MNTISGLREEGLNKELEAALARVAVLENKLCSIYDSDPSLSENKMVLSKAESYVHLVENIDQGVLVLDENFDYIFVNQSALQIFKTSHDDFDIPSLFHALSETAQQNIYELLVRQKISRAIEKIECDLVVDSGEILFLYLKFIPVFDSDCRYEGVQIVITDITEERVVKQALKRSEKLYKALFDGAGDAIFVHDEGGTFIDANNVACDRLGYSLDEILKMTPDDLISRRSSRNFIFNSDNHVNFIEHSTKNGNKILVEVNSRRVDFDGENKILTIARDITDRIDADKRAVLNRNRLRALYEMAHMNESSSSVFFDFALSKGVELSQSELGFITLLTGHGNSTGFCYWSSLSHYGKKNMLPEPESIDVCGIWKEAVVKRSPVLENSVEPDSSIYPFTSGSVENFLAIPIRETGKVVALAVFVNKDGGYDSDNVRNLTLLLEGMWNIVGKKKSEEKVRKSLLEKETLLKEVHHRVKNNMQVICSLLNLQTDYIKDPQDLVLIKHSIDRVRSMAYVHEQLYRSDDLSSIDFGKYIKGLGSSLINSYGAAGNVEFVTSLDSIMLPIEQALPCGLIVNELLTNAITHAFPEDYIQKSKRISVKLEFSGENIFMTVSDNGIGIENGLERTGSLGHVLIDTLVNQIEGSMKAYSDNGAKFDLVFKMK